MCDVNGSFVICHEFIKEVPSSRTPKDQRRPWTLRPGAFCLATGRFDWDCGRNRFVYLGEMFKPGDLFDLSQTAHAELFTGAEHAWDALKKLKAYIEKQVSPSPHKHDKGRVFIGENVFIGEGTVIEDGVMIKGPAIIGSNCEIRHNAYIRDYVVIGDQCVIGNSCEFKHALLFNNAVVPHFSYVGDSILGHKAHLGAGVKISNVKLMAGNVTVEMDGKPFDTGLRKFGALLGDHTDIGCNSVLNPGSIIGRGSVVYPNTSWRGVLPANMIVKNQAEQEVVVRRVRGS
jgi:NDP-sugar pyrophosphorylase family protein